MKRKDRKRIIITGCAGFIGYSLIKYLSEDYDTIGIDRQKMNDIILPQKCNFQFYHQDINDSLPDLENIYAVIHLAASPGVRDSHGRFSQFVDDNILGTKSILDKCIEWNPEKILIASSSTIYNDDGEEYHPRCLYGVTKITTELLAEAYKNSGLLDCPICCMRIFSVYGPNQRKELAIRKFIDKILKGETITVYGDGTQERSWTYIDDICKGIEELLNLGYFEPVLDMGNRTSHTLNEVIYLISKITGKNVKIKYEPWNRFDSMKTKSSRSGVDWSTQLEEGLKKQIAWQEKQFNSQEFGRKLFHSAKELDKGIREVKK